MNKEQERREKISKMMQKRWQDPVFREKIIKKQKEVGYRNYGNHIWCNRNRPSDC